MGLFDFLDNPGRAVGIDPAQIAPEDRNAYRGMTLTAFGNQLQGGTDMFSALGSAKKLMDERALKEAELKKQQAIQGIMEQEMGGGAPQGAGGPAQAPGGPAGGPGGAPGGQMPPQEPMDPRIAQRKQLADKLRNAGARIYRYDQKQGSEMLKQADELDPMPKYGQTPHAVTLGGKPALVSMNDQGGFRVLQGLSPELKLGQPVAMNINGQTMMVQLGPDGSVKPVQGASPYEAPTSDMQNYQYAQTDPRFMGHMKEMANLRAPKTTVNLPAEDQFGKAFMPKLAEMAGDALKAGNTAQGTLQTLTDIETSLDQAMTGPLAGIQVPLSRLKATLGGQNPELLQRLEAHTQAVQGMATIELKTAEYMQGQGPITENERALIRRAAGLGENLTPTEIRAATKALRKQAEWRLTQSQNTLNGMNALPAFQGRLAPIMGAVGPKGGAPAAAPGAAPAQAAPAAPGAGMSAQERARKILEERNKR